ncbi:recombinase family protein, partial [Streptococcus pneumoniae]|uniref:recombinase family protein n=1 Tax=Streptococcus pneumoniae TaxID=1313 RepID=UPI001EFD3BAA
KDWNVYKVYTDGGFSGSNTDRPALESLIKDAKKRKFDTVLVYKLDRLSRSQKDTLHLIEDVFIKNGIEFLSLQENFDTSTPFGKAMIGLLSVFAQLEREQNVENQFKQDMEKMQKQHSQELYSLQQTHELRLLELEKVSQLDTQTDQGLKINDLIFK